MPLTKCKGFGSLEGRCAEIGVFPRRGSHAYLCPGCIEYRQGRAEQTTLQTSSLRLCRTCGNGARLSSYASQGRPGLFYHDCLACRNKAANADLEDKHRGIAQRWAGENSNKQERPDDIDQAFGRMGLGDDSRREPAIHGRRRAENPRRHRRSAYIADVGDRRLRDELAKKECFYCGDPNLEGHNTSNRVGTLLDDTLDIYASCCVRCLYSKGSLDGATFVKRCRHVAAFRAGGIKPHHHDAWPDANDAGNYADLQLSAQRDGARVELTKKVYDEITSLPCVYCGFNKGRMNVEEVGSSQGHRKSIMVSCCTPCNLLKHCQTKEDFFEMCRRVARTVDPDDLPAMKIRLSAARQPAGEDL